jgi:hypothetical protein
MLKIQVTDPTRSQKVIQIVAIASSALVAFTMTLIMDSFFNVGLCKPISCWLQDKGDSWGDDVLLCYMMTFIPYVIWNFSQLISIDQGLISDILKPYIERMNIYIAICVCSIMFETYCVVMEILVTDFRNTRLARSLNMILNLTSLLF